MTQPHHVLEIYEPYEYEGPNPLTAEGVAVLAGPMRDNYYLLQLDKPFEVDHQKVEQLLVLPRYNGDKIDRAVSSTCTVNIARIPPGTDLHERTNITFEDFECWGVGKISLKVEH